MVGEDGFEWDDTKASTNFRHHGVSFREAADVFADPLAREQPDVEHSDAEERSLIIGEARSGRLLVVVYTLRRDRIRVISARLATRQERHAYEEED